MIILMYFKIRLYNLLYDWDAPQNIQAIYIGCVKHNNLCVITYAPTPINVRFKGIERASLNRSPDPKRKVHWEGRGEGV